MFWMRRYGVDVDGERGADSEFASEISPSGSGSTKRGTHSPGTKSKSSRTRAGEESFLTGGVSISPMPVTAGEKVMVKYNGLLAQSGADTVYLHAGFGDGLWKNVADVPMAQEKPGVWKATLSLDPNEMDNLNFCFKDRADNWDNNYGLNWSVRVHNGQL